MAWVIAGIYEIQRQIGAGGGGIVYLGRHLRLDKQIVLKADKRTLNTDAEILRREVDMLKGLSHMYIPQVHDFVQENGIVYTVMDYIEGESLDYLLKRGEAITQSQVIKWACQILEALDYLHSRPPYGILHGDIKPANIMLRPSGDICLIDYNIALALGEDGAVRAGFSRGYASPEHYGIEYADSKKHDTITLAKTEISKIPATAMMESNDLADSTGVAFQTKTEEMDSTGIAFQTETEGMDQTDSATQTETEGMDLTGFATQTETEGMDLSGFATQTERQRMESAGFEEQTETMKMPSEEFSSKGGSATSHSTVMLDVRSDIYSLGATLYHLLSGRRPALKAPDVKPLGMDSCSLAVAAIIHKSMAPSPKARYQSAREMLTAFRQLHKNDIRTLRHKRRIAIWAAGLSIMFLAGGASAFTGMKRLKRTQECLALAEYSANHLAEGDISGAVSLALQAIPKEESIFEPPAEAQAWKALTDALGVYDLADGFKSFDTIELPSAPFAIRKSPGGTYIAVVYEYETGVFDMESGQRIATLPMQKSALADVAFADENCIVYAGEQGVTAYDLDTGETLWTGREATTIAVSGDGCVAAAVNRDEDYGILYRISDGTELMECSFEGQHMETAFNDIFANPHNRIFSLSEKGDFLAVSFSEGGLWIFDLKNPQDNMIIYDETNYRHFEGGFCGNYFAFAANKSDESMFGLIDVNEGIYAGSLESRDNFHLITDSRGIYLANGNLLVSLDPDTYKETELAYTNDEKIMGFSVGDSHILTATDDNRFSIYDSGANLLSSEVCEEVCDFVVMTEEFAVLANRNEPSLRLLKKESHKDSVIMSYDARYAHDEARVSQDGRTVMLFDYETFCICDRDGNVVAQEKLPESREIYDQQFRKSEDGSWLEVIWYDGTVRLYSAKDGSMISEIKGKPPEKDLFEEFYTDQYRIESSLHSAPVAYDRKSGRKVKELETESYLTYVTQLDRYIITEYVSAAGERYGLLLDDKLETLAYLPGLCDIADGKLVFDYGYGDLRECHIYSLQELKELGQGNLQKTDYH